ncbi:nucleoside hydrolase [Microbacterium mangrovi]|uniref:nucleoside hydrolase n=1 Tax=Microbacterium mangrovi TaxID=1348253 RepID=UPI00069230FC|nr:nucleoside hydrolase [Microbacterium mangrovi]
MSPLHRVLLDTDIGTDVDDLMALALILGSPEIELVGVTTVYGDTRLRAQLTARVLATAGRSVPIHAGESATLSGREVWWAGHEGVLHADLDDEHYESDDAVQFLVDTVLSAPGEIDLIAIGPLTNVARAIAAHPSFAGSLRHLWVMGGAFTSEEPEHNFRSDAAAARIVFAAGIPTTVTGLEVTRQIHIGSAELTRIAESGRLGRIVQSEIEQWWRFWNEEWNVPHDPVTVLTLTRPRMFRFSEYGVVAIDGGDEDGVSRFLPGQDGRTRITVGLDAPATALAIVDGIVAGSGSDAETAAGRSA